MAEHGHHAASDVPKKNKKRSVDEDRRRRNRDKRRKAKKQGIDVTPEKAREMLRDGTAHGRPLTEKQKVSLRIAAHPK